MTGVVSIIIPTLNEAKTLPGLLAALPQKDPAIEIIISDGGSNDRTAEIAREASARLVTGARGRGQQIAAGIDASRGDIIWMLHADTLPGSGALAAIRHALNDQSIIGGNFRIEYDGKDEFSEWLTGFYGWFRAKGLYYGDSAVFIRKVSLAEIGGIRPVGLMEDFDLTRRMERTKRTVCIDTPPVVSSARRFRNRKRWRIFLQWLWIHALYYLRVDGDRLARLYHSEQHTPEVTPSNGTSSDQRPAAFNDQS